jgi:hypothetical protein
MWKTRSDPLSTIVRLTLNHRLIRHILAVRVGCLVPPEVFSRVHRRGWLFLGAAGDVPVGGDFDGDGVSDIAVYHRVSTAQWFVLKSSTGFTLWDLYQWGQAGDVPIGGFR